jgi:hypothetical protein
MQVIIGPHKFSIHFRYARQKKRAWVKDFKVKSVIVNPDHSETEIPEGSHIRMFHEFEQVTSTCNIKMFRLGDMEDQGDLIVSQSVSTDSNDMFVRSEGRRLSFRKAMAFIVSDPEVRRKMGIYPKAIPGIIQKFNEAFLINSTV